MLAEFTSAFNSQPIAIDLSAVLAIEDCSYEFDNRLDVRTRVHLGSSNAVDVSIPYKDFLNIWKQAREAKADD